MKILMVHNYYQISGGEDSVVENEKKLLEEYGNEVVLYTRKNKEIENYGIVKKILLPFNMIFNVKTYFDIKNIIRKKQIDIVHVHNTMNIISASVYYAAVKMKIPVIQTVHNFRLICPGATLYCNGHICEKCINHSLFRAVKCGCYRHSKIQTFWCVVNMYLHRLLRIYSKINYICLTEFNKKKLLSLKQVKSENVFVKPNFAVLNTRDVNLKRNNQFVFLGRLDELKGIDFLLDVWKKMNRTAPKLIVCGDGPLKEYCEEFISKNHLNIEMMGFVKHDIANDILSESKAMIIPTKLYEGFPMSIVEAYSVGTPVICPNMGNAGDAVQNGVTGYKYIPDSKDSLIEAIKKCKGMNESTFNVYKERYTKDINYKILSTIYNNIKLLEHD